MNDEKTVRITLKGKDFINFRLLSAQIPIEGKEREIDQALGEFALKLARQVVVEAYGDDNPAPADAETVLNALKEKLRSEAQAEFERSRQEQTDIRNAETMGHSA